MDLERNAFETKGNQFIWKGIQLTGLDGIGLDWTGLDWIGLDWAGLDWIALAWIGLDWTGLDWTGLDWTTHKEIYLKRGQLKLKGNPLIWKEVHNTN